MLLNLNQIGQIGLSTTDVDRAEQFFSEKLGLRKLYRFGDLLFFDCGGVRLFIEGGADSAEAKQASPIYFRCADIALATQELKDRGISFTQEPHLIAKMDDHDLWMAFFVDPDEHVLALMHEAPKGYKPEMR